jgi:hypothetical protein
MKCQLCLRDRKLCDSHIIPELLYRPLYGPTHQVRSVHTELPYVRFPRKGLREPLLCDECEGRLSRYETYFAGVWYGESGLPAVIPEEATAVAKSDLDSVLFKLFHLSILWRASVATINDFAGVKLGPHQERLRLLLLAGDAGPTTEYRLGASVLLRPRSREVHAGVISVPTKRRHDTGSYYSSIYAGCIWHCFVSKNISVDMNVLTNDGSLTMVVMDIRNIPGVSAALARAGTARRKSRTSKRPDKAVDSLVLNLPTKPSG